MYYPHHVLPPFPSSSFRSERNALNMHAMLECGTLSLSSPSFHPTFINLYVCGRRRWHVSVVFLSWLSGSALRRTNYGRGLRQLKWKTYGCDGDTRSIGLNVHSLTQSIDLPGNTWIAGLQQHHFNVHYLCRCKVRVIDTLVTLSTIL